MENQYIRRVEDEKDIIAVAELAKKIWNQHYVPIIGQDQVDYMLDKFQSVSAMTEQVRSGYEYYLLSSGPVNVGYLALVPAPSENKMMISKIYVDTEQRGGGHGGLLLEFAKNECQKRKAKKIWLTVNKYNSDSIDWYKRRGFVVTESVKQDVGNGFFMDDYIMEMEIA